MTANAKNWLCTAAQTTFEAPPRYSLRGVPGRHPIVRLANQAALTSSVPPPLYHKIPTAWPLSRGPIGVAVPTIHSCAGRFKVCEEVFLRRTFADIR